jgi:hypothetical protein
MFFVFVLGHSATVRKINAHRDQLHLTTNDVGLLSAFKSVERTTVDRARIMKVRESGISLGEKR